MRNKFSRQKSSNEAQLEAKAEAEFNAMVSRISKSNARVAAIWVAIIFLVSLGYWAAYQ